MKRVYISYDREYQNGAQSIIKEFLLYLPTAEYLFLEESDVAKMDDCDLVICVISPDVAHSVVVLDELKHASDLNKKVVGIYANEQSLEKLRKCGIKLISESIRSGFFKWGTLIEKNDFVLQLISFLGEERPIGDPVGVQVSIEVFASSGFDYTIDQSIGQFHESKNLSFRLLPGTHYISLILSDYPYCCIDDELIVGNEDIVKCYDLDSIFEELGYEDTIIDKNGNLYCGRIIHGLYNGEGFFKRSDGSFYEGTFSDGSIKTGKWQDAFGNLYEGQFNSWKRHGEGKYTSQKGEVYEGTWDNDKFSGHGLYVDVEGNIFEGEFIDSIFTHGTISYLDGTRYCGFIESGKRNGQGMLEYPNGDMYSGSWEDNLFEGEGQYVWKNRDLSFEGYFKNGHFVNGLFYIEGKPLVSGIWNDEKFSAQAMFIPGWEHKLKGITIIGKKVESPDTQEESVNPFFADQYENEFTHTWEDDDIVFKGGFSSDGTLSGCFFLSGELPIVSGSWKKNVFIAEHEHFPNWRDFLSNVIEIEQQESLCVAKDEPITQDCDEQTDTTPSLIVEPEIKEIICQEISITKSPVTQDDTNYFGDVVDGVKNGKGILTFANGSRYEGYWKDNLFNGEGSFYWGNSDIFFVGNFVSGAPERGIFYLEEDLPIVSGHWNEGEFISDEENIPAWKSFLEDIELSDLFYKS